MILRLQRAFTCSHHAWSLDLIAMIRRLQERSGLWTLAPRFTFRKAESSRTSPLGTSVNKG